MNKEIGIKLTRVHSILNLKYKADFLKYAKELHSNLVELSKCNELEASDRIDMQYHLNNYGIYVNEAQQRVKLSILGYKAAIELAQINIKKLELLLKEGI